MSLKTLEIVILAQARFITSNPRLKMADILEWSTSESNIRENLMTGEIAIFLPDPSVWIAIQKSKSFAPFPRPRIPRIPRLNSPSVPSVKSVVKNPRP